MMMDQLLLNQAGCMVPPQPWQHPISHSAHPHDHHAGRAAVRPPRSCQGTSPQPGTCQALPNSTKVPPVPDVFLGAVLWHLLPASASVAAPGQESPVLSRTCLLRSQSTHRLHVLTHVHATPHKRTQTHMHACAHTYWCMHTCTGTHAQACTHYHMHAGTHCFKPILFKSNSNS